MSDLEIARKAQIAHAARAGQLFVDTIQAGLRRGDEAGAAGADRALRVMSARGTYAAVLDETAYAN